MASLPSRPLAAANPRRSGFDIPYEDVRHVMRSAYGAPILKSFNPRVRCCHDSVTSSRYVERKQRGRHADGSIQTSFKLRGVDCVQCDNELIAPEKSEYRDERYILHLWRCSKCDCRFDVISPADTKSIRDIMTRIKAAVTRSDFSPSTLVA